jgi:hypothetical protein
MSQNHSGSSIRLPPALESQAADEYIMALWNEAVSLYRESACLSVAEQNMLESHFSGAQLYRSSRKGWELFHTPNATSNTFKTGMKQTLEILESKIDSMDVVIGYPIQAVMSILLIFFDL